MQPLNTRRFYILAIALLAVTLACSAGPSLGEDIPNGVSKSEDSTTINVVARDFSFSIDESQAEVGRVTFLVQNNGSMHHDFAIRGNGVEQKTPMIQSGESATLTVELEPGTYTYVCTIPGHDQLGMSGNLVIGGK